MNRKEKEKENGDLLAKLNKKLLERKTEKMIKKVERKSNQTAEHIEEIDTLDKTALTENSGPLYNTKRKKKRNWTNSQEIQGEHGPSDKGVIHARLPETRIYATTG